MQSMFNTTPAASDVAKRILPALDRPVARIVKFLFADEAAKAANGSDDYGHAQTIQAYGIDGLCLIEVTDLPPCIRKTDEEWPKDADGNYPDKPTLVAHVHKPWCNRYSVSIPFKRGPFSRPVAIYRDAEGKETGRHEWQAWGWDGNREKPSLTPSYLTEHFHSIGDMEDAYPGSTPNDERRLPGVFVWFHVFVGDPYGPGTGRFGPGNLDVLESHIKTHDGRQVPMLVGGTKILDERDLAQNAPQRQ